MRLVGVHLAPHKQLWVGLQAVRGIGKYLAMRICELAGFDPQTKVGDLSESEQDKIRKTVASEGYVLEGDLRREVQNNIKRLMEINCYRGSRHRRGLPVRGQHTKNNSRTRKGKRKQVQK